VAHLEHRIIIDDYRARLDLAIGHSVPVAFDDVASRFEQLARRLGASGCSPDEVERVRVDQGVDLPWSYECFLRSMGRDSGGIFAGSELSYPEVLGLRRDAQDLLRENGSTFTLPPDALVFWMHQGYQFAFMQGSEGPNPTVRPRTEVTDDGDGSQVITETLFAFLEAEDRRWSSLPSYESNRRSAQAFRMLAFGKDGCPTCGGRLSWSGAMSYSNGDDDSGRVQMEAACLACGKAFWRWADTPQAPLEPGPGPRP
jgi:hypothetical protein